MFDFKRKVGTCMKGRTKRKKHLVEELTQICHRKELHTPALLIPDLFMLTFWLIQLVTPYYVLGASQYLTISFNKDTVWYLS